MRESQIDIFLVEEKIIPAIRSNSLVLEALRAAVENPEFDHLVPFLEGLIFAVETTATSLDDTMDCIFPRVLENKRITFQRVTSPLN